MEDYDEATYELAVKVINLINESEVPSGYLVMLFSDIIHEITSTALAGSEFEDELSVKTGVIQ